MIREFVERYILFPEGVIPESKIFKLEHLICFILAVFIFTVWGYFIHKQDNDKRLKTIKMAAVIMISLEVFRIVWWMFCRYNPSYNWFINLFHSIRFDWCNQVCLIMPFVILFKKEKLYDILVAMALIGGLGVLLYPASVFDDYAGLHLMSIQSYLSHALMIFIAGLMVITKSIKADVANSRRLFIGFAIAIFIALSMAYILPGDRTNYMNAKKSIMPIINLLPHPYYLPFQFIFMFEAILLVYFNIILFQHRQNKKKLTINEHQFLIRTFIAIIISISIFFGCLGIVSLSSK